MRTTQRIRRHLAGNVVAYAALFIALTIAPAYAITVRSGDIVDGQVKRQDIARDAVNSTKIDDGSIVPRDLSLGARSRAYFDQDKGFASVGTTYAPYASVTVPKGSYVVYGHGLLNSNDTDTQVWDCELVAGGTVVDFLEIVPLAANFAAGERESITLMAAVTLGSSGAVVLRCKHNGGSANIGWPSVTAVRVASVVNQ